MTKGLCGTLGATVERSSSLGANDKLAFNADSVDDAADRAVVGLLYLHMRVPHPQGGGVGQGGRVVGSHMGC